ncbi:MAG: mechanosensitive ion channel domain-containing protein [Tepidisphaerales bacterium]
MTIKPGPIISIALLMLATAGSLAAQPAVPATQPQTHPTTQRAPQTQPASPAEGMTAERLAERLAAANAELAAIAADVPENSPDAQRRMVLLKRVALFKEYAALLASAEQQATALAGADGRVKLAQEQLADFALSKPATLPSPTQGSFEALKGIVTQQRDRVASLRSGATFRRARLEETPKLIAEARARADDADKRSARLADDLSAATDAAARKLVEMKIDNARLERFVAQRAAKSLLTDADVSKAIEPARSAELELAEKQLERLEQQFAVYSQARQDQLLREQQQKKDELARKQQQAATAQSPADRFVARWEAEIALSEKNQSDLDSLGLAFKTEVDEQEKLFAGEKDEFTRLQEFLKLAGASERTSDRIKQSLQMARQRRVLINKAMRDGSAERIAEYRTRRFDIEDTLVAINDRFKSERDAVLAQLPDSEKPLFAARTAGLLDKTRSALRAEKDLLAEAIGHWNQLQILYLGRLGKQDQMERFIRANAFWLRDARPLGLEMANPLWDECKRLADWARDLVTDTVLQRLIHSARSVWGLLSGLLLFPILPIILIAIRQRLRRFVANRNDVTFDIRRTLANRLSTIGVAVVSAALLPVYWYVAAQLLSATDLAVPAQIIEFLSFFLFFWLLARAFFGRGSMAHAQLGIPRDAATSLYTSMRLVLLGCAMFLIPTVILRRPPFEFETIPRLLDTLTQCSVGLAILWLIRPRSAFMRHALAAGESNFIARRWGVIGLFISLLIATIIALDMAGYRYGSWSLAISFIKSVVTLIVLVPVYTGTRATIEVLVRLRRASADPAGPDETPDNHARFDRRVKRVVRFTFVALALYLLAGFWGMDAQAFKALDEVHVRSISGSGDNEEFLSAADLLRCLFYFGGTFWLLWALPGIYELAVFPRLRLDQGLKYAILTISRYAIFTVGVVFGLSAIHLDLTRLGWLVAAIGVGLGFGLQEIVSNFVCGIILLVERPVQVGDIVTVSGMSGTVTRINIRATTILNFDRQEVILPNRNLITTEVTNWTRGDTINRTVIKIGVAYGSDIDLVTRLLSEIARAQPDVLKDPPPSVMFVKHGDSSLDFELSVFIPSPQVKGAVHDRVNKAINREFAKHKIEIPFPQHDVHIRSGDAPLRSA